MIRTTLLKPDGSFSQKQSDLSDDWNSIANDPNAFCWIDISNEDPAIEKALLEKLNCHPLAIIDTQRLRHPPKLEVFTDNIFILYRGITSSEPDLVFEQLQIALFATDNLLITRHNNTSFSIEHWWKKTSLSEEITHPLLLASKIIHTSFGRYLEAILDFEQSLSEKEEAMQASPNDEDLRDLLAYKGRLRKLRRTFNYHTRCVENLLSFVKEHHSENYRKIHHEIQDVFDRTDRITSLLNMYYEICGDLIEGYLSITSHQLNRTMQILTVVTTIFVPLGFLAGIYGMNFENIPELHNENGYFYLLGTMGLISVSALTIFKIKRWI
ncbi:MAG: magnesium transporter CorA family protein [Cellvibrionaceae bacterium]